MPAPENAAVPQRRNIGSGSVGPEEPGPISIQWATVWQSVVLALRDQRSSDVTSRILTGLVHPTKNAPDMPFR